MSSFEWMELQSLASEITVSRSRLATARANRDRALVRALEAEITEAEQRRTRLLAQITNQLAATGTPDPGAPPQAQAGAEPEASAEAVVADDTVTAEAATDVVAEDAAPPADPLSAEPDAIEATGLDRAETVWDELTLDHLGVARDMVAARRTEMLARHAEELRTLDADLGQLQALEQAIDAFARKFTLAQATGAVVQLDEERELRMQSSA